MGVKRYKNGKKVALKDGCTGCGQLWDGTPAPGRSIWEGQCSRCKRCLECCGRKGIEYSCAWKFERRAAQDPGYASRSARGYENWQNNVNVLGHNRRIV